MLSDVIFKANDIRGIVIGDDAEWDLDGARRLGAAFVRLLECDEFVLGRDMRQMGQELAAAFADGARRAGATVVHLGLTSTDELWYASGVTHLHGVQFTASHNPAQYNGIKFCLADARPVPVDFMTQLRDLAPTVDVSGRLVGSERSFDPLPGYALRLHELVPIQAKRRLKVVVDAGNGMAGHTAEAVLSGRNLDLVGLYLELDGTFPNHPANPLVPENLLDARRAVVEHGADLGLVFDGDADRCFIVDEHGEVVDPSIITALIAEAELVREPGGVVVTNTITSQCVDEAVRGKGRVVRSRVGHTYVKAVMAEQNAIFGGEHSAHYYFRDFWSADTGMLAALHVIEQVRAAGPLSSLTRAYDGYVRSGEINSTVAEADVAQHLVGEAFADRGVVEYADGVMIRDEAASWWVNVRPSNTEPLLRVNVEARDQATMERLRDEVLTIIRR